MTPRTQTTPTTHHQPITLPQDGMSRLSQLLPFLPIGKSTVWAWVRAEKLLAWLVRKGDNINKTTINRNAPYRGKYLDELLTDLENANYIQIEIIGRSKVIKLNPKLFT